ncbi:FAD-dependent oxidoreductase [Sphingobium sp.]|uniref:FAD-dependent oxidoreductase n=1 Tax=Sphingobium sp. TaxID=1912891 RepID=UPI0028BE64D4|nr:FAD-dependent oxidoreductase [Sphingobium sp.]
MKAPQEARYDTLVIGSGAAGLSAALSAALHGLKVLVVEKTEFIGGTTAWSGGAAWLPANPLLDGDTAEAGRTYIRELIGNFYDPAMIDSFIANASRMIDCFQTGSSSVRFQHIPLPDYHQDLAGSTLGGRSVIPLPYDARKLGPWLQRLRHPKPEMTVFGGMQAELAELSHLQSSWRSWSSFRIAAPLVARYLADRLRFGRGTRTIRGTALAGRLLRSCLDAGVEFWTEAKVQRLIARERRAVGAVVWHEGSEVTVHAARGVVIATGGFIGDPEMRKANIPYPDEHIDILLSANIGDGIRLAREIGAALGPDNAQNAIWSPGSQRRLKNGALSTYPHFLLDRCKPGAIMVDRSGRRFVNEGSSYHTIGNVMHERGAVPGWLIADHRFLRKYGMGMARPAPYPVGPRVREGYLIKADTIAGLAAKIGVDPAGLEEEVTRMNRFAEAGVDEDFGKGADAYSRFLGDAEHKPSPSLGPIRSAPFYALALYVTDAGTTLGLRVDPDARVLDEIGQPIPALFAAGLDMNSVLRGHYPGGGSMIGPALTFGYVAGRTMAEGLSNDGALAQ